MAIETYWRGAREHVVTTVSNDDTPITTYQVAAIPYGSSITTAVWVNPATFDNQPGIWIDQLPPGIYRILAKAGATPGEIGIIECGIVQIRSR